jgi:hypothetical protein
MAAPKGHVRYGGKQKGSKNKKTLQWEAIGEYLIGEGVKKFLDIMRKADNKDYLNYYCQILEYFKPKLARTELTGKNGEKLIPPTIIVQSSEGAKEVQNMINSVR